MGEWLPVVLMTLSFAAWAHKDDGSAVFWLWLSVIALEVL